MKVSFHLLPPPPLNVFEIASPFIYDLIGVFFIYTKLDISHFGHSVLLIHKSAYAHMFTHRTYVLYVWLPGGFPGGSYPRESACNARDLGSSWVRKIPWRRAGQPTPVIWPGESHGQRNLAGYSLWGCKESDITEQLTLSQAKLLI